MKQIDNRKSPHYCARLESQIDYLETELTYLDQLLKKVGFPNGIVTVKQTAEDLLTELDPPPSRFQPEDLS